MQIYHGTDQKDAKTITGPPKAVDVSRGRGELGQGFYAGSEPSLAAALTRTRRMGKAAVLQITIDVKEYLQLKTHTINKKKNVARIFAQLKKDKTTTTHKFGKDVIVGPFATIDFGHQYKFESIVAQKFLNNSDIFTINI